VAEIRLTNRRRQWLEKLLDGPATRSKANTAFYCMQAGWSEWNYVDDGGMPITVEQAREHFGYQWWRLVRIDGERITELGRQVLEGAKLGQAQ
jgi:hypothetical protein